MPSLVPVIVRVSLLSAIPGTLILVAVTFSNSFNFWPCFPNIQRWCSFGIFICLLACSFKRLQCLGMHLICSNYLNFLNCFIFTCCWKWVNIRRLASSTALCFPVIKKVKLPSLLVDISMCAPVSLVMDWHVLKDSPSPKVFALSNFLSSYGTWNTLKE